MRRTDIAVVTRMAKFITISLLAYAAAFLLFTPVSATDPRDEPYIQGIISAVPDPTTHIDPLSYIKHRIDEIVSSGLSGTSCTKEDVFKSPEEIPEERIPFVRSYHHTALVRLNRLLQSLTVYINDYRFHNARQVLPMYMM
ncbi:hypothetical protein SeLEV6574_g06179 [Synchytrium endobioticum]|uniref:Uncharacterized protein n=1 Tax=Synchytrium endobioticum TaxID=286115 RepID=A0A507CQ51_9FUNG|nr:hypothetical protein SeLEV6574_g06179 [Synchytrium endobioticum]